jgi:hypothetical protein
VPFSPGIVREYGTLPYRMTEKFTWYEECTAIAKPESCIRQTFQFTIGCCVNLKEFQLTFTIKITLSPGNIK